MIRRICVFCGSSLGTKPAYAEAARELGAELTARGLGIVYGGARRGLMGLVADAALAGGGEVIGVLPRGLFASEIAHRGLTRLEEVDSMHARKARMAALADAFIALPGGFGTCDELFEIITWAQLGLHAKPIGILDVADYFAPLREFIRAGVAEHFIPPQRDAIIWGEHVPDLVERIIRKSPPPPANAVEPPAP